MDITEKVIAHFRQKMAMVLWLKHLLFYVTIWCFIWGVFVMVMRSFYHTDKTLLLFGLIGVVPLMIVALVQSLQSLPGKKNVRALLDRFNGQGGLLMAQVQVDMGAWQDQLTVKSLPQIKWKIKKPIGTLTVSILFVVVSFMLPERMMKVAQAHHLEIDHEVETLVEQIELLKEEDIYEEDHADLLVKKMNQVKEDALGEDPLKTFEALDHMEDKLKNDAQSAAQSMVNQTANMAKAQALSGALAMAANDMEDGVSKEAMKQLNELMNKAVKENQRLKEALSPEMMAQLAMGNLSPTALAALSSNCKGFNGKLLGKVGKFSKLKLIDSKFFNECKKAGQCDSKGLAKFLKACKGKACSATGICDGIAKCVGNGSVTRGRGDAEMTWQDESDESNVVFREQVLPEASLSQMKDSTMIGLSLTSPKTDSDGVVDISTALNGANASGGSATTVKVLPKHRGAVGRYFDRKE